MYIHKSNYINRFFLKIVLNTIFCYASVFSQQREQRSVCFCEYVSLQTETAIVLFCILHFEPNQKGIIFTLYLRISCLKKRKEKNRVSEANCRKHCLSLMRKIVFVLFLRQNPSLNRFSAGLLLVRHQHIHYSCERQGEHTGKLGLAPDLWGLINGPSVLQL